MLTNYTMRTYLLTLYIYYIKNFLFCQNFFIDKTGVEGLEPPRKWRDQDPLPYQFGDTPLLNFKGDRGDLNPQLSDSQSEVLPIELQPQSE